MSKPDTIESVAGRAMAAAKASMGATENREVYDMNSTDQGNVTAFAVELVRWDAARMAAEAVESRRKPTPQAAQSSSSAPPS